MKIAILGAGNHGTSMVETLLDHHSPNDLVIFDDDLSLKGSEIFGVPVQGPIDFAELPELVHVAIGDNELRKQLGEQVVSSGRSLVSVVGPLGYQARSAKIGAGIGTYAGAKFFTECEVGVGVIIGDSIVDRRCKVGDWVRIAHGITMAPRVEIGEGAVIGTGAVLMAGVRIGDWATVGAGAVVVHDVKAHDRVAGVPAQSTTGKSNSFSILDL